MKHENLPINVKILLETRRLIARGWVKGMAQAGDSVCLMQALWIASRENQGDCVAVAGIVRRFIGLEQIPSWNDCAWRTLDEVLGVLDEAIGDQLGRTAREYGTMVYSDQTQPTVYPSTSVLDDHFFNELEKIGG